MPKPAPSSLVLETDRVSLRHFHLTDAASFARVFDDAYAQRFYPDMTDEAAAQRWIARNLERYTTDGFGFWPLCLRSTGELIGDCDSRTKPSNKRRRWKLDTTCAPTIEDKAS